MMPGRSFTSSFKPWLTMAVFALCLAAGGRWVGKTYAQAAAQNKINAWSKQRFDEFYATSDNTLDMVFLGSSHSYCTFDPEKIDPLLGTNSYQLGMPLQHPDASHYTLLEVLNTQKPDTVVLELYWGVLEKDFDFKQVDTFFQVLQNEPLKERFVAEVFPLNEKVKANIKPVRYQQDFLAYANKELLKSIEENTGLKPTIKQNEGEEYYRSKGYIYCNYTMNQEALAEARKEAGVDGKQWQMSSVQQGYIEKIAARCKEEGIALIFVTAPVSNVAFDNISNYGSIHEKIDELARQLDVPYLDFNMVNAEEKLFADSHFRDARHLNDEGVKIADEYFAAWYNKQI